MVSSDFGKLDARRHLTSGLSCAIAGAANGAAAKPTPAVAMKFRRFIFGLSPPVRIERGFRKPPRSSAAALLPSNETRTWDATPLLRRCVLLVSGVAALGQAVDLGQQQAGQGALEDRRRNERHQAG